MGSKRGSDEFELMRKVRTASTSEAHWHRPPLLDVGNSVINPFCEELLRDATYQRELAILRKAALVHTRRGIDIREVLSDPITHEVLISWQDASESLLSAEKGRQDLLDRRRHYILRTDDVLPLDLPLIYSVPFDVADSPEYRFYVLNDEKEYLPIGFNRIKHPATTLRPILPIFKHGHVRAILDWKAQTFDSWLSLCPQFFGGHIVHEFSDEVRAILDSRAAERGRPITKPRAGTHRVVFDSWLFWLWYVSGTN